MSRWTFSSRCVLTALACALIFSSPALSQHNPPKTPSGNTETPPAIAEIKPLPGASVALVVIDAVNRSHTALADAARDTTPHLLDLANRSIHFTDWISNAPWTRPAFTTILTGLPKERHQMELNDGPLSPRYTTLAQHFRRAGYDTAAFIGNPVIQQQWGYARGFQHFEDTQQHGPFPDDALLMSRALSWLADRPNHKPFFLLVFLTAPHAPWESADGTDAYNPPREVEAPPPADELTAMHAAYHDELRKADAQLGRLLQHLASRAQDANTIVMVTADHGEMLGDHNCFQHATHMWEDALRVPAVLHLPGVPAARGIQDRRPMTHEDVLPLLLDATGLPPNRHSAGFTLSRPAPAHRVRVSQYDARGILRRTARLGDHKLVYHAPFHRDRYLQFDGTARRNGLPPSLRLPTPAYALFHLGHDPGETRDLFRAHRGAPEVQRLLRALHRNPPAQKTRPKAAIPTPQLSPELEEALRQGGYIQ